MNTLLYIKSFVITILYQGPILPPPDTDIDAAPIDDYLILGLIVGMLLIVVLFKSMRKTGISNKIS